MSIDLGTSGWQYVGLVDGFAMLSTPRRSRWIDLNVWPGKLLPAIDEPVVAVAGGHGVATLGPTVRIAKSVGARTTQIALPAPASGVGFIGEHVAVVGDDAWVHDGDWRSLRRDDPAVIAITRTPERRYEGKLLVYENGKHRLDGVPIDFGSQLPDPEIVIAAPCGLVALIDGRYLKRLR